MTKVFDYKGTLMTTRRARQILPEMKEGETIKAVNLETETDKYEEDKIEGVTT